MLIMIVVLFAAMYFMMIRPQQRRRREAMQMQSSLGVGDKVVTIGGMHGTVTAVDDEIVTLEVSPGVQVRFARPAIAGQEKSDTDTPAAADEANKVLDAS